MVNSGKKYVLSCLIGTASILVVFIVITYVFDPFFHYHKPYNWVSYDLNYQRYQNDGIVKNFDYDAIITGTSMIENFRTTELDSLFEVNSVKIPLSGASHKELNDTLLTAVRHNKDIKLIFRSLDVMKLFDSVNSLRYAKDSYPWYLYDEILYNDVKYVFNKSIFFSYTIPTINRTINNKGQTTFDDYSKWYDRFEFGKEVVDDFYERKPEKKKDQAITDKEYERIKENYETNIIQIAKDNPDIDFYLFVPPYSIYYWDYRNQDGLLTKTLDAFEYTVSLLVEVENIHLYSFINEFDIICNMDLYKDTTHYNEKINSQMLVWMKDGHDLVTKDNYKDYLKKVRKFYSEFKYDKLFIK